MGSACVKASDTNPNYVYDVGEETAEGTPGRPRSLNFLSYSSPNKPTFAGRTCNLQKFIEIYCV